MKPEFDFALYYVKREYPHLFGDHIESIKLIPAKQFQSGANGLCYYLRDGKSRIEIRRRICHVSHLIETIYHELIHAQQWKSRKEMTLQEREDEAYKAGQEARAKYMDSVGGIRLGD